MSKDLEVKKSAELAVFDAELYGDVLGAGLEGVSSADVAIPYLTILQALSPQYKKGPQRIEGTEEGDIYNTLTRRVVRGETGVQVIPCAYQKRFVEWIPRNSGGGFVASHTDASILNQTHKGGERGTKDVLPTGNEIVTTAYHYSIIVSEDGDIERVVIAMTSTQLKKSRSWNAKMMAVRPWVVKGQRVVPPIFAHSYRLTTTQDPEKNGQTWFGWVIGDAVPVVDRDIAQIAKSFYQAISGGDVAVKPIQDVDGESAVSRDAIPF